LKNYGDIDSKFRFVILASKRAKELLLGAKPKIKSKSKNPIRIAQNEIAKGLIDFEIIHHKEEEGVAPEEEVYIGEKVEEEVEIKEEKKKAEVKKKKVKEKKGKKKEAVKKVEPKTEKKPKKEKKKE
jgi:DNA-directed RNA polymerase omega subunit